SMVTGPAALRFLVRDKQFPRSVQRCLIVISGALLELCRHDDPMAGCAEVQRLLAQAELDELGATGLHDYADRLQQGLGALHDLLVATYFPIEPSTETVLQSA
ncbi:MAG TPA: alpha-E domain-containing protein, partial [Actinomycetota bacterium]